MYLDDVNNTGWVYVYDLNTTSGEWALSQSIQSPLGTNSYFGSSVRVLGNELIVGASGYRKYACSAFHTII